MQGDWWSHWVEYSGQPNIISVQIWPKILAKISFGLWYFGFCQFWYSAETYLLKEAVSAKIDLVSPLIFDWNKVLKQMMMVETVSFGRNTLFQQNIWFQQKFGFFRQLSFGFGVLDKMFRLSTCWLWFWSFPGPLGKGQKQLLWQKLKNHSIWRAFRVDQAYRCHFHLRCHMSDILEDFGWHFYMTFFYF